MHATDRISNSQTDTTNPLTPAGTPGGELSPEQLAALAQTFRAAVTSASSGPSTLNKNVATAPAGSVLRPPTAEASSWPSLDTLVPDTLPPLVTMSSTSHGRLADNPGESLAPIEYTDDTFALGNTVLESMQQQSKQAAAPLDGQSFTVARADRVEKIEQIVAETVTRVLVSDPLHDGRREVRVSLQPDLLPQTEVRLWREAGRLHVEFISTPATLEQSRLADHLPRLAEAIHQRHPHGEIPSVSVSVRSADTGGQPGDGRSRQQYQPVFEDETTA